MSKDVRKCEIDETQDECATRKFIDDLRHSCKCLPLNLRLSNKVKWFIIKCLDILYILSKTYQCKRDISYFFQDHVCTHKNISFATKLIIAEKNCLPKCSGLQVSSYYIESIERNKELIQDMDTAFSLQLKVLKELQLKVKNRKLDRALAAFSKCPILVIFISWLKKSV